MKRELIFFCVLVLFTSLMGCQSMTHEMKSGSGVYLGSVNAAPVSVFNKTKTAHYLFWGLVPISRPDINDVAKEALGSDQRLVMANIKIDEKNDFLNGFCAAITYGLYRPRTIEYSGRIYNREVLANEQ